MKPFHSLPSTLARLIAALTLPASIAACGGNVIVEDPPATTTDTPIEPTCGPALTPCGDDCVDLSNDPEHCGACWNDCGPGAECQSGTCQSGTTPVCPEGTAQCGPGCYNLSNDPGHCGSCDNVCNPDELCNNGSCWGSQCVTCGVFITEADPNSPPLCPYSEQLYDALVQCVCDGPCTPPCGDNACAGTDITMECQDCILDQAKGCGNEYIECANDI